MEIKSKKSFKKTNHLQNKLKQTHFNLVKKTLFFIRNNYDQSIHIKEDPMIYIDLIESYYLKEKNFDLLILQKILKKLKTRPYIENSTINNELINLLTVPWSGTSYFTCLHLQTLETSIQNSLENYFEFVKNDLNKYISISVQILDLTQLLENKIAVKKKIKSLKFNNDINLWYLRKTLHLTKPSVKISFKAKHTFITVQLILLKKTLESETYQEIYFFRDLLTDFLFLSKLVT